MVSIPHIEIPCVQYINEQALVVRELPTWTNNKDLLLFYYQTMVICRVADQKAISLQRTGQMGTYPSALGQEAISTVFGKLLASSDVLVPYYRDHAAKYQRNVPWRNIYLYWGGDERGSAVGGEDFPDCVPIATQCLHAVGVATAMKIRNQKGRVVLCSCGDGSTSKGDFLEALNVAGAWQLPIVFVINNNQWAISVSRNLQCGAPTLAQKGVAAQVAIEQVDGNDVVALHESVSRALQRARAGKGASLIEAISYRLSDHTTADDASRYRPAEDLAAAWEREPIKRLQSFLHARGWWSPEQEQALQKTAKAYANAEAKAYLQAPVAEIADIFDYQYETLPAHLAWQKAQALAAKEGGKNG